MISRSPFSFRPADQLRDGLAGVLLQSLSVSLAKG